MNSEVVVQVFDDKDLSSDELVGQFTVPLDQIKGATEPMEVWFDLENEQGSVRLEFTYNYQYSKVIKEREIKGLFFGGKKIWGENFLEQIHMKFFCCDKFSFDVNLFQFLAGKKYFQFGGRKK